MLKLRFRPVRCGLLAILVAVTWSGPVQAQPLMELEHNWTITVGEQTFGMMQLVQRPGGFRTTTIFLGPWMFPTQYRAVTLCIVSAAVLATVAFASMLFFRRRDEDTQRG